MTELLSKLFIKDYKNTSSPAVRSRYGVLSSVMGIVMNILLAAGKLVVGIFSGSIAIMADALNNFSDAASSIVTFVSFKIASKPADREHPFGHARIEYVCSMVVSFIILIVGFELLGDSITRLINPTDAGINFELITFIVLGASIAVKLFLAYFNKKIGKKINSGVISASSTDALMDAISTLSVLVSGIIVKYTSLGFIDSVMGILVSGLIMFAGIKILNETKNSIIGEAPLNETVSKIKSIAQKHPEIIGIHDLLVHNYGPGKYIASFHAEVDGGMDIYMLHDVIDNVEREINSEANILCTIHMDPIVTDDEVVCELRSFTEKIVSEIYPGAGIHDFRTVVGVTHTNLIFDAVIPFEIKENDAEIIEKIKSAVIEKRSGHFCVVSIDRA